MAQYHTHISARHKWLELNLKEVWNYRDLIYLFTKRNFVVSYKQTILGPAWLFLTPLIAVWCRPSSLVRLPASGRTACRTYLFYLCSNCHRPICQLPGPPMQHLHRKRRCFCRSTSPE